MATATAPAPVQATGKKDKVTDIKFVEVCVQAEHDKKGIQWIAETLGLNKSYVQQRRTQLKNAGVAIPELGRGTKKELNLGELNGLISKMTNTPLKDIEKTSSTLISEAAARKAQNAQS